MYHWKKIAFSRISFSYFEIKILIFFFKKKIREEKMSNSNEISFIHFTRKKSETEGTIDYKVNLVLLKILRKDLVIK